MDEIKICIIEFIGRVSKDIYTKKTSRIFNYVQGNMLDVENVHLQDPNVVNLFMRLHNLQLHKFKLYIGNHIIGIIFVGVLLVLMIDYLILKTYRCCSVLLANWIKLLVMLYPKTLL
jgi:hypothetical protein